MCAISAFVTWILKLNFPKQKVFNLVLGKGQNDLSCNNEPIDSCSVVITFSEWKCTGASPARRGKPLLCCVVHSTSGTNSERNSNDSSVSPSVKLDRKRVLVFVCLSFQIWTKISDISSYYG